MSEVSDLSFAAAPPAMVRALPRAHVFVERQPERPLDPWIETALARVRAFGSGARRRSALALARSVEAAADALDGQADATLNTAMIDARRALKASPDNKAAIRDAAAIVCQVIRRTVGLKPFAVQIAAGCAMYRGCAVEMDTGEGKTLSTMIAAALHAMAQRAVHVVAANDYLAERDASELADAYERLGLSVAIVLPDLDPDARRQRYRADIVYVSSKEIAFDYLRDRLGAAKHRGDRDIAVKTAKALGNSESWQPVVRALDVALVDEIDSVLIDDAGTPLLISTETGSSSATVAAQALELVSALREDEDYRINRLGSRVEFTDKGLDRIAHLAGDRSGPWRQRIRREELASQALSALHLFHRDEHYIVRDGKVVIIDPNTGRTMADRFWGQGLHQMIELKEGLDGSGDKKPLISSTFQRFFRRYRYLGGTSGTIGEVAHEISAVYRLKPVRVPRRQPNRRVEAGRRLFDTDAQLWAAAASAAAERNRRGQPVLIGTRSVEEADAAADALRRKGLDPVVLSASQDADEAAIVAAAGKAGAVTVATNIAGRGTDIRLADGVADLGGLSVFLCQRHHSRRVDRQLIGRCARQGDPGEMVEFVSRDDPLIRDGRGTGFALIRRCVAWDIATDWALRAAQRRYEAVAARQRWRLMQSDRRMAELLAFAGALE